MIDHAELSNLFHVASTALCGPGKRVTRWNRMRWACDRYHERHPEVSRVAVYKALDRADAWRSGGGR